MKKIKSLLILVVISSFHVLAQEVKQKFDYLDVFELEYAGDPQISPDGKYVVYNRIGFDILKDRSMGNLWIIDLSDPKSQHKLTPFEESESGARWSPNGDKIVFSKSTEQGSEIYMYWIKSGAIARLTQLENSPSNFSWSPDGNSIAFTMKVNAAPPVIVKMPAKPKGAVWAGNARITDRLKHEADGAGYVSPGFTHLFTIPAEGGTPRQITEGNYNHRGSISWSPDGNLVYFSSNRTENWEYDYQNSIIYSANLNTLEIKQLTSIQGPENEPTPSPDGKFIAYVGFQDKVQAYQTDKLHLMKPDGSDIKIISDKLDRSINQFIWASDSKGLYISYNDLGKTKIGYITITGKLTDLVDNVGGTSLGRPYSSGSFSLSNNGKIAYTLSHPQRPADVAVVEKAGAALRLTDLNRDLLNYRTLGKVEEIWYKSSVDQRDIQGWIVYPPDYTTDKAFPLIVENHGGPIANYGPHFSAEIQLYANNGYVVFYPNTRGSTSYGEEFGNLIFNNYPGEDYNDVMDGVDALIQKGIAHEDQLYVTGGSAGGIMSAWIIGKNNRFEAAVVAKPVMNWMSKTLVADNYFMYADYRIPKQPWENFEGYWKFSPLSLVGNIETPTMVIVGMNDLRTPPSEAKQLYHALKLRKIETVLVEIPEAYHGIANKPSNLISKIAHTLAWFEKYRKN